MCVGSISVYSRARTICTHNLHATPQALSKSKQKKIIKKIDNDKKKAAKKQKKQEEAEARGDQPKKVGAVC
jgi:hypothetical protein